MTEEQCVICMDKLSNDIAMAECRHKFCKKCILKWIKECSECPLCRSQITKLRFFHNGFYIGDEISVQFKQQKNPDDIDSFLINEEELSDDDFYDDMPLKICMSPTPKGTTWKDGHRSTTRKHNSEKPYAEILRSMTQQLQKDRIKKMNDKLYNELFNKMNDFTKQYSIKEEIIEKQIDEICNEERGKNKEITDDYVNELIKKLQKRIFRDRLISSFNDNSDSLRVKRRLIPLSAF